MQLFAIIIQSKMSLQTLPLVIGNLITQFLNNKNNSRFIKCCKIVKKYVVELPRQSEFIINHKSRDLYCNYRNLHVNIGLQTNFHETRNIIHKFIRMCNNYTHIVKLNRNKNIGEVDNDLCEILYNNDDHMVNIFLERLPIYNSVEYLNVLNWGKFNNLKNFPNINKLAMEFHPNEKYPNLDKITHLITNTEYYHTIEYLPNLPNVKILESHHPVPDTYIKLTHLVTRWAISVSDFCALNITHLDCGSFFYESSTDVTSNEEETTLSLKRFPNLQKLVVTDGEDKKINIIGYCPDVIVNGHVRLLEKIISL